MESSKHETVEIFFFPFVGGGHQIPIIDMARIFALHGAKTAIITTPTHSSSIRNSVHRDQNSGHPITIHTLTPPSTFNTDMSAPPFTDTSVLEKPLRDLLVLHKPDCIVHDMFHRWSADVIDSVGVPRITFNGNGCFAKCVHASISRFRPFEHVGSDYEPFVVPGLPDLVQLTKSRLPVFLRENKSDRFIKGMLEPEEKSFGVLVNSFYDLELAYVEIFRAELCNRAWIVGPVSLYNVKNEDKFERGKMGLIDQELILSWLESKEPKSVLYVSFGSLARLSREQLRELCYGLENANHPFILVVGQVLDEDQGNQASWFPRGFEDRMQESKQGLIIKGWAPQLFILEHESTGGFMTHCGWNSTLEGVCAGVPMITWPISAEQFSNETLITDVLKIGVKVGSVEWASWNVDPDSPAGVGGEKVEIAVKRVMGGGEEAEVMRRRAEELRVKARRAVDVGGSSFNDVDALILELKSRKINS